jgi:hypothetical protein
MSGFQITAKSDPEAFAKLVEQRRKEIAQKMRRGVESGGRSKLLLPMRDATRRAFPTSRKLPTTWRGQTYPTAPRNTLEPAYSVFSAFPPIIRTFQKNTTIRPTGGKRFLWIPTENVPRGAGGKPQSPKQVEAAYGAFVVKPAKRGKLALVEAEARAANGSRERRRRKSSPFKKATRAGRQAGRVKLVPMFILVRQVTLRQRIDPLTVLMAGVSGFVADVQSAVDRA